MERPVLSAIKIVRFVGSRKFFGEKGASSECGAGRSRTAGRFRMWRTGRPAPPSPLRAGAAEKPFEFDLRVTGVDPADQLDVEGSAAAGESGLFHRA